MFMTSKPIWLAISISLHVEYDSIHMYMCVRNKGEAKTVQTMYLNYVTIVRISTHTYRMRSLMH